jgi:hypothetical protein
MTCCIRCSAVNSFSFRTRSLGQAAERALGSATLIGEHDLQNSDEWCLIDLAGYMVGALSLSAARPDELVVPTEPQPRRPVTELRT